MTTLLPPAAIPEGASAPLNAAQSSVQDMQNWQAIEAQSRALAWNTDLASSYLNYTFPSWLSNYEQGKVPPTDQPPTPPAGFMVDVTNPWNPTYVQIGPQVCAIPTYTRIPLPSPPGTVAIGVHLVGNYWQALPTDTAPGGYTTPTPVLSSDGTLGIFQKIVYPFGGWWYKVS